MHVYWHKMEIGKHVAILLTDKIAYHLPFFDTPSQLILSMILHNQSGQTMERYLLFIKTHRLLFMSSLLTFTKESRIYEDSHINCGTELPSGVIKGNKCLVIYRKIFKDRIVLNSSKYQNLER